MTDLALIIIAFVLYWSSIRGMFVFDDVAVIWPNQALMTGDWRATLKSEWRQVVLFSYALNVWLFGPAAHDGRSNTGGYHAVNILVHGVNAVIVRSILETLGCDPLVSWCGALFFVTHPLACGAVAAISGRHASLSATFGFLAVLAALSGWWLAAFPLAFVAIFTKEDQAMLIPLLAVLGYGSGWWWLAPALAIALCVWKWRPILYYLQNLHRMSGEKHSREAGFPKCLTQPAYGITALTANVLRYPAWVVGTWFNPDPDVQEVKWYSPQFALALLIVGASIYGMVAGDGLVSLGLLFILLSPLPLYVVVPLPDVVMEYRAYFSLLGLTLLAVHAATVVSLWLIIPFWIYLTVTATHYAAAWETQISFWESAILRGSHSKPRVLLNCASAYMSEQAGKLNPTYFRAEQYIRECLKVVPDFGPAWGNLANITKNLAVLENAKGNDATNLWREAARQFKEATEHSPDYSLSWLHLGECLLKLGEVAEAEHAYRQVIRVSPNHFEALHLLGVCLLVQGKVDESFKPLKDAFDERPDRPENRFDLGMYYYHKRDISKAKELFKGLPGGWRIPAECAP